MNYMNCYQVYTLDSLIVEHVTRYETCHISAFGKKFLSYLITLEIFREWDFRSHDLRGVYFVITEI